MRCQRLCDIVDMELAVGVIGVDPDKKDSLMQEGEIPLAGVWEPEMAEVTNSPVSSLSLKETPESVMVFPVSLSVFIRRRR